MKIIQKRLNLNQYDFYVKHLEIVSCLLPTNLTKKEIEVLAGFMSLDKNLTEGDMFNSVARKKVMAKLDLVPGGLGNHLKHMLEKNVIYRDELTKKLVMREYLEPNIDAQGYKIIIINDEIRK